MTHTETLTVIKKIEPALRTTLVNEYYFAGKLRQIAEMRQRGIDVINLGIGSPDMPPAPEVIEKLYVNALDPSHHGYQSYNGLPVLRHALADWYSRWFGVTLDPEKEILPLMGSKEGIMHITMAFINEGDEVLVPDPGYPAYAATAKLCGGKVRYYDLKEKNNWLPDIPDIEARMTGREKIMWINYPHMPTGSKASPQLFRELVDFARRNNILICNDNPYSFILNETHLSILSVKGARDNALELNSLSKSHNMAGWRIGMVAGDSDYIRAILRVKSNMDSGMFQPLQAAAAEALSAASGWYDMINMTYSRRRKIAQEILNLLDCPFDSRQRGLFLWAKIPAAFNSSEEFTEKILNEAAVFTTPGFVFGTNGEGYVRISLCADEQLLAAAKQRIEKFKSEH